MNKTRTRSKTINDPVVVTRVKTYLAENVDKRFVDVSQMARSLKERYREYNNRSETAFCKQVESAYKAVLRSYGLNGPSSTEVSEEESDLELLGGNNSALNDRILAMYKMQDKKRPAPRRPTDKSGEPIDIISSDEDNSAPKLPKINDQITITPHVTIRNVNSTSTETAPKQQLKIMIGDKKKKIEKPQEKQIPSKKKFEVNLPKEVKVNFEDIGGISDIVTQICDLILHMRHPEVYSKLGIQAPRGALLHGPPGTGKTLLAHAIAGQLQLPLVAVTGTELVGGMSGESEERIRELFEKAISVAPCVLFIDELDAVCGNRIHAQKDMEKRMVAQLLASFDSLSEKKSSVLILAATNNPDALDPALRRAGRLEQEITLGIPSLKSRKEILSILCKNLVLSEDIDLDVLAQITPGFVGADLQALVNKASTYAVKRIFSEIRAADSETKEILHPESPTKETALVQNGEKNNDEVSKEASGDSQTEIENDYTQPQNAENTSEITNEGAGNETVANNEAVNNDIVNIESPSKETNHIEIKTDKLKKLFDPVDEVLNLLEDVRPYSSDKLSNLSIRQEDFVKALKTTKPCSVREGIVTVPDVTWDDVGSLKQVRRDLQLAVLAPVKYPEQLKKLGLAAPSGVLLCGPPGCGKTLLAKAVANEAGVNFISVKGPELLNMYVGESERAVRTCFRRARNSAPCVIFFDEFDALCPRRTSQDHNGAARVVNQLLTEMDGIEGREGVFVLAASNRPDIIDPAVLRPGRLDRIMYVGMPARDDRVDILHKLTKGGTQPMLEADVNLQIIGDVTEGYTGADLAGLVKAAATNALKNHIANDTIGIVENIFVTFDDFRTALSKCKPSVSAKERLHYDKLGAKYASGADDKDIEMETEPTNEEFMDTI